MPVFFKYHGAGNDFILFDDRDHQLLETLTQEKIATLCARRTGIGADGLMLLRSHPDYDFEMVYFNADGAPSSMCGNGGRCLVRFAYDRGIQKEAFHFLAVDGPHRARRAADGIVALEMHDVARIHSPKPEAFVLDTGSPHYVAFVADAGAVEVVKQGRAIRTAPPYAAQGINVNFVSGDLNGLQIATYERGVEDETLACGTGVTAAAVAAVLRVRPPAGPFRVPVAAKGGQLRVEGHFDGETTFSQLWLVGPTAFVFQGTIAAL